MDTIKLDAQDTRVIAHRGLSGIERENTCPAFVAAANRSYFGIESDVRKTSDGRFVMIHDETSARITNGRDEFRISETDLETLSHIKLPDIDGNVLRSDIRIPTLEDYVSICKKYGKRCILEVKEPLSREDARSLISELSVLDYLSGVTFISFVYENCTLLRELLPDSEIQFLTDAEINGTLIDKLAANRFDLDIYYKRLTKENVSLLHSRGIKVNCFTCDDPGTARLLIDAGVDYITTNILE